MPFAEAKPNETPTENSPAQQVRGADTLKAQMSALRGDLSDLRRLQRFLDNLDDAEKLARARHLIETMPAHENAGAAAWRIAAIASLDLEAGRISDVGIDTDYRLVRGAIGWDFGPDGATVHHGFTPVTPSSLVQDVRAAGVPGRTTLTDGIASLRSFEGSLPNGLYRVLIIRDGETGGSAEKAPFGGGITINGTRLNGRDDAARARRTLSGNDNPAATPNGRPAGPSGTGLGIQGWAIVEHGRLRIDFGALPAGLMIAAVIAEPFDIDKVDLQPQVADSLAEALGSVAPAAGPAPRAAHRRLSKIHRPVFIARPFAGSTPLRTGSERTSRASVSSASGTRFATSRRSSASPGPTGVPQAAAATDSNDAVVTFDGFGETDPPHFEDRQLLVKRSARDGEDSDGMAIDLGSILDDASLSGTFLCDSDPCAELPPIAAEPDLTAAAELLGDWLEDPANLTDGWSAVEAVLGSRGAGAEIAVVYEFDVDAGGWTDLEVRVSAGSGIFVWLDGDYIFGASNNGAFVDDLEFEYRIELPDLASGTHFLQILSESHLDDQGFALELRGTPIDNLQLATTSVDEPGTLFLLGFGLLCFAWIARRHVSPRQGTDVREKDSEENITPKCASGAG